MAVSKDELMSLVRRDPLAFGITFVDLLEDKQWEVESRAWVKEIYATANPWLIEKYPGEARRMVVTKSTQSGISSMAMTKALHFAVNWPTRIGYTLPRQQDTIDFVTTRFDAVIRSSDYLKSKLGVPDSTHAKRIGNSYIFFMEMSTEPRMLPIDSLYVDEVDLSNPDNLASVLNRLDASRWKMVTYLSTPTVPNYGIHGLYNGSDMRQWLVKCPKCGTEQPMDWEVNLRIVGPQNNPVKVFYGCAACNSEITVQHMQTGRWVAQHPELSKDLVGFHVHQLLTTPADQLYKIFRDPQTKLIEFYRKRLGKPYEVGGGSIERDDFLATCFDAPYVPELENDGKSTYYMGADQGNELQVLVAKVEPHTRRPKLVHVERIPIQKGFDRLAQLMDIFRVRKAVLDANPNRHDAIKMVKRFPGRILIADYSENQKEAWRTSKGMAEMKNVTTNVTINRTTGFDALMDSIKQGHWQMFGEPPNLDPEVELVIDQVTALKRDVETRRTAGGETQVNVWRKLRADHFAHSWLYLKTAWEAEKGRNVKVAVIGAVSAGEDDPDVVLDDRYKPPEEIVKTLTSLLAEVPAHQLTEFIEMSGSNEYELPFPLSYKLGLCRELYTDMDILYVMQELIKDARKKS